VRIGRALVVAPLVLAACQAPPRREPVLSAFAMNDVRMVEANHWGTSFTPPTEFKGDATGIYPVTEALREKYIRYSHESDPAERTRIRNDIAYTMLTLIKHYHDATTDDVYELTAGIASAFDIFSMAMGGLGAATGSSADKAAYSALAAFGIGTRSALSKNILAEQTSQAILMQMEAMRIEQETKVRDALKRTDTDYPLQAALTDLFDYYAAGSVKDAVAALSKAAQEAKQTAQEGLKNSITSP
jgi:hypothetical protein